MVSTFLAVVENKSGVLIRCLNIFAAKGINVLNVSASPEQSDSFLSNIAIIAEIPEVRWQRRIAAELEKLINVLEVFVFDGRDPLIADGTIPSDRL